MGASHLKPKVERLPWDSSFFGLDVGRVTVPCDWTGHSLELKALIRDSSLDLAYVLVPESLPEPEKTVVQDVLVELSGVLYDKRTVFRKRFGERASGARTAAVFATRLSAPLEELAYASGVYSRFALDPRLAPFFRPMYRLWLEKELANGKVFVWPDAAAPQGMATISVRDGEGKIGLVAVDAESRGKGIASRLMAAVDAWLQEQGVGVCEVATQGKNLPAQALYRKAGFFCCDQQDVWHVWRREP